MSSFLAGSSNQRHYFLCYTLFIYNQNNFSSSQSSLYYRHRWYWVLVFIEGRKLCWCEIQSLTFCPAKHPTCLLAGVLMTAGEHGIMPGAVERTIFLFTIIQYKCECQHTHTHTHTDAGFGNDYGDGCRLPGPIIPSQILHPPPLETEVHIFFANKVVHALHVCMYCRYARVSVSVCKTRPWFCTCLTLHPQWKSRLATTSFLFMWCIKRHRDWGLELTSSPAVWFDAVALSLGDPPGRYKQSLPLTLCSPHITLRPVGA